MNEKTEQEIIEILDEQRRMRAEEHFAGNIVKEEFHRGAIFGIKLVVNALEAQPAVEPDVITCPKCGETEPTLHCEGCGHNFNRPEAAP